MTNDKTLIPLRKFLNERRCDVEKYTPTHYSYGSFIRGSFYINDKDIEDFMLLYSNAINDGCKLSILEKQKEVSPILIDIDLKDTNKDIIKTRLYDDKFIFYILKKYIKVLDQYIEYNKSKFTMCIFEKDKCIDVDTHYKDGLHIVFPTLCLDSSTRHFIRMKVVDECETENLYQQYSNTFSDIIDKAVVSSNGWFLYGSHKQGSTDYKLTRIYNSSFGIVNFEKNNITKLVNYFSFYSNPLKYNLNNKNKLINKNIIQREIDANNIIKKSNIDPKLSTYNTELYNNLMEFINMLNIERASNFEDWRNVGLSLYNTDSKFIDVWIEFSSKCKKKFDEKSCYTFWNNFKSPSHGRLLTIRSLAFWAKIDSPGEYNIFINELLKKKREMSTKQYSSTYDLAKAFYTKYNDQFAFSSSKTNDWWYFNNHRWKKIDNAYVIRILLSEEFSDDYRKDLEELQKNNEENVNDIKIKNYESIIKKLKTDTFKNSIVNELKNLFMDMKFEEKLDSNENLIGYENGIYDLGKNMFRNGLPDDYISLSTRNIFIKYSTNMKFLNEIKIFLKQIIPNENIRKYFIIALSTCVAGYTRDEKFYILTGSGSNGKSLLMDLMKYALGEYFMPCATSIITKKRGNSNETSPEKVRMKGKRCGIFQETASDEKINVGIMKEFTGGDTILMRDLFKGANDMIELKPQMKFFLTCNILPEIPSTDDGTWRRLRVIDFVSKFVDNPNEKKKYEYKIDIRMKEKIKEWGPVFLSFLINIYMNEYLTNSLKEPNEVMLSTNKYKANNDVIQEFYSKKLIITNDKTDIIYKEKLYTDFINWYKHIYDNKSYPKQPEFETNIAKILGECINDNYICVKYNICEDNDITTSDNIDIDNDN